MAALSDSTNTHGGYQCPGVQEKTVEERAARLLREEIRETRRRERKLKAEEAAMGKKISKTTKISGIDRAALEKAAFEVAITRIGKPGEVFNQEEDNNASFNILRDEGLFTAWCPLSVKELVQIRLKGTGQEILGLPRFSQTIQPGSNQFWTEKEEP